MSSERDVTRVVESWLEEGPTGLPDRVIDAVVVSLPAVRRRHAGWLARRSLIMNNSAIRYGVAVVAVVAVVLLGINLLPGTPTGGPTLTPPPSQLPASAASSPTPSASSGWPSGALTPGQHDVTLEGIAFSFAVDQAGWRSDQLFEGLIEKGAGSDYHWIAFNNPFGQVSTDPCTATAETVGPTIDDFATAMTSIPGTDASEPMDTTVGGLPAKLVVLTLHDDIGCVPTSFYLYGQDSAYPSSTSSVMRAWIFMLGSTRYVIQADQSAPDDAIAAEIQQVVDSIQFR